MKKTKKMKETKTFHAVHDQSGNIKSILWTTGHAPAHLMAIPEKGYSVSRVNLHELKFPGQSKITLEEQVRVLRNRYRVDTSTVCSLVRKAEPKGDQENE